MMPRVAGNTDFIAGLAIIVISAFVFSFAGGFLRVPSIVLYLLAGLVIGPIGGLIHVTKSIDAISEAGIALMLFLVGLEMSIERIRVLGTLGVFAGLGQVVVTFGAGWACAALLGFGAPESAFAGVALMLSSTVVVIKLLTEKKEAGATHGRIAIGVLLVQDVTVIVLLTLLAGVDGGGASMAAVVRGLGTAIGGMLLLVAVTVLATRFVLPRLFAGAANSPQTLFVWSLAWCFLVVAGADAFHLSHEVGAFLAGIGLAQLPYNRDLHRRVHPLMNFFIAVFFVTLGVELHPGEAFAQWPVELGICAFVLLAKPVIVFGITRLLGFTPRSSLLAGLSLAQISEFSFIFLALAHRAGFVSSATVSAVGMAGLLTIAISSFLIQYDGAVAAFFGRWFPSLNAPDPADAPVAGAEFHNHVIVVGMNTLGRRLGRDLTDRGEQVLAIDTDPAKLRGLPCATLLGNIEYLATLEEAGLPRAKLLVSALQIEESNELLAFRCQACGVPSSILAVDMKCMDGLLALDVGYLMIPKVDGIKMQNRQLEELGILAK